MIKMEHKLLYHSLSSIHQSSKFVLKQRSKSLPSINLQCPQPISHTKPKPKILKKTWDKVKTIIHPQSSSPVKKTRPVTPSSLPNTPLQTEEHFEFEDQQHRIARNYELLQKRLSEELHQRMNECGKDHFATRLPVDGLSDEFRKRLVDWETNKGKACEDHLKSKKLNNHQKELAWLDKQLEKIEREKKRLEREMNKYLEKEARLEKMKEALNAVANGSVVVRTPTAKCRVEKITEKFAKKLYEWEEKRGVSVDESGFGLLKPEYFEQDDNDEEEDDDDEVLGPLDLINARLEEQHQDDVAVRKAMEDVAEAMALADEMMSDVKKRQEEGRVSSTASSCCCSEYEQTDSKHSNTDSEVYKIKRPLTKRRRSSAESAARSPSLSAFTSDDEEEMMLKEEEPKPARDAESQTEIVVRAKQIVVEDNVEQPCCSSGVFVQTKRTIFAPVMDGGGEHKTVVIGDGTALKEDLDKPVVVGMVPKNKAPYYRPQPKTQFHRSFPTNKVPVWCSPLVARRHFNNESSSRVPRKYTIGGGYMPRETGSSLLRSNSFGLRNVEVEQNGGIGEEEQQRVSKSKSTGSIKSRFKMFGGWFKSRSKEDQEQDESCRNAAGFSLRRIGSWVYRKGE